MKRILFAMLITIVASPLAATRELRLAATRPSASPGRLLQIRSPIVFNSTRDGNDEIYRMNPDGSSPARVIASAGWNYSPDW